MPSEPVLVATSGDARHQGDRAARRGGAAGASASVEDALGDQHGVEAGRVVALGREEDVVAGGLEVQPGWTISMTLKDVPMCPEPAPMIDDRR